MFKGKMTTPAIPERVYELCILLKKGPVTTSDLKNKMEPDFLGNKSVYFNDYKLAAEELGLASTSDNVMELAVDPSIIDNERKMRKYINLELEKYSEGQFYQVTKAFYLMDAGVLKKDKNVAALAPEFSKMTHMEVDAMSMRAWRFWASFLGFGYLQDMFVIPNAKTFLEDVIQGSDLEKGRSYSVSEFVEAIEPKAHLVLSENETRKFNFGVSNGLRTLQELGMIRMEHKLDHKDIWRLYHLKEISNDPVITNITIL